MVLLLVRHDPAFSIKVDNMLEVLGLEKKRIFKKKRIVRKRIIKKESTMGGAHG